MLLALFHLLLFNSILPPINFNIAINDLFFRSDTEYGSQMSPWKPAISALELPGDHVVFL